MEEAITFEMPSKLRGLFVTLISTVALHLNCGMTTRSISSTTSPVP